jgi:tetratricopeptide (TPR) repeat protein
LALLCNAAVCALKRGASWFATWLASRVGLAAIALGVPERAWRFLDGLTIDGRRHPHLDLLAAFEPLRRSEAAQGSPWVRAAICRLWPGLGVPVVPSLPFPSFATDELSVEDTLDELSRIGATQVRALVESFVEAMELAALEHHADEPLVRELRKRAVEGNLEAPTVDQVPAWFRDWARAVGRSGEVHLARLAGLVLHAGDSEDKSLSAVLVLRVARAQDLEILAEGLAELQPLFAELTFARGLLPVEVADALVATALPHHARHGEALAVLAQHLEALAGLGAPPGGVVDHIATMMRAMVEDRQRDHAAIRPHFERLTAEVRREAGQLNTAGRRLSAAEVERAAAKVGVPEITTGLLEVAMEVNEGRPALDRLLLALALRKAVGNTNHALHWGPPLAKVASDSIYMLREPQLFELRLRLLDEAIQAAHPVMPNAELYFQRANMRRAVRTGERSSTELALADFRTAIRLARSEGNAGLCASATAAWVKALAWRAAEDSSGVPLAEAESALVDALDLPLEPIDKAAVHQARAHLVRMRSPEESVAAFETALALLVPGAPFWIEVAAELVATLLRVERVEEAVQRGTEYLNLAGGDGAELGMLHVALGEALLASGRWDDAQRRLENGLQLVRGRDSLNEAIARLQLARLGLVAGNHALTEEHLRFVRDHREELDPLARRDLELLEAAAVAADGDAARHRAALVRTLATVKDERVRVGLRLEIARIDVVAGHLVEDLDEVVMVGLETALDDHHEAVLTDLICNHGEALAPSTRDAALHWARLRRPSIVARLQHQAGQTDAARATLRAALSGELDDRERLACAHQLMTLLDNDAHAERLELCAELERLLDVDDVPHVRLDLAAGMRMAAGGQLGLVLRARAHALRAMKASLRPQEREFGHRTMGRTTVDLLRLSLPLSSPSLAQDASLLLEELALAEPEVSQLRLAAAHLLLLPGPLTHPDAVSVAGRLLDLVTAPPDARTFGALTERLRLVRDHDALTAAAGSMRAELRGPFDELPSWLVDQVRGRGGTVAPEDLARAAGVLATVTRARPDVADALLAMAISVQHKLSATPRQEVLEAVYSGVQAASEAGSASWPRLREALAGVRKKHRHPMLSNILSVVRHSASPQRRDAMPRKATANERKRTPIVQIGSRQRARDCFDRAVELMKSLQLDPHAADAAQRISESRVLLGEAAAIARKKRMPELFDFLVSHGNAWRMSPDEDIEKALRIYESAAKLDAVPDQEAKLWKVQADALRLRGADDDLRRADRLLERACRIRRGRWLAETLMTRAHVALAHPDLDEAARQRGAVTFAMDAARAHRGFGDQDGFVSFLLHRLAAWEGAQPNDPTPARVRDELKTIYPARAAQIDAPVPRVTGREGESVVAVMMHPAGKAFLEVRMRLATAEELGPGLFMLDQLGPSTREAVAEQLARDSLVEDPDSVEDLLSTLSVAPADAARPGRLAARVVLLGYLARIGRRSVGEVRSATAETIDAIGAVEEHLVRSTLLRELAVVWSPNDHAEDPVRDFALAADLLRRCLELEGGEDNAAGDTLAFLARALRYTPVGDLQANLREARRLYALRLERARAADGPDVIANLVHNLAEVESQMGTGSRLERMRAAERQLEEAAATAQSLRKKAQYTANLAWERTQIGTMIGGAEGRKYLEKAIATFDEVDPALLDEHGRRNVEGNRHVCEATLARLVGGPAAEIASWRAYLAKLDEGVAPYSVATAKHNLASALMFGGDVTREALSEGLRLSREAAEVRTLEANPRHHWETAINIGRALLGALTSGRHDFLTVSPGQAAAEAGMWLRRAAAAARTLGPGEELLEAAFALLALASGTPTPERFIEATDEAWAHVRQASAYLLLDPRSREREAWAATETAVQLAYRLAERSLAMPSTGLAFVLHGESARLVERWIVRAQQPARRALLARLSRPQAVSVSTWDAWRSAVSSRDQSQMADALDRVRETAPTFLAEEHANDVMWRWLEARPGSVAVALVLAEPVSLALLMQTDDAGERKTWVLGLELEPPPLPLDTLAGLMRSAVPEAGAHAALDELAQWVRRGAVEPIVRFLGASPSAVLWSPGPGLRLVAPSAVWRGVPVVGATSLLLPDLTSAPSRRRSSLLVLADPGADAPDPQLDLRGQGVPTLEALERAATRRGPVRLLGSVGAQFGRSLLGERSVVRNTPASARDVLLEAAEHETVILVAHGEVATLEDAAVLCTDASGSIDRLDVGQLERSPDAFAGATILLLSCEGGRMGDSLVNPGGLAGTLLAAGAACVVAPLWPVRLDAAEQVGCAVLDGMTTGDDPWSVLAKLHVHVHGGSPTLGRPPPSLSERQVEQALQRLAFVAWVG